MTVIDQLPYGEPGKPVVRPAYLHGHRLLPRQDRLGASRGRKSRITINGATPERRWSRRQPRYHRPERHHATVAKDGREATYVVNITRVDTDFRGNVMVPVTATAQRRYRADNAAPDRPRPHNDVDLRSACSRE